MARYVTTKEASRSSVTDFPATVTICAWPTSSKSSRTFSIPWSTQKHSTPNHSSMFVVKLASFRRIRSLLCPSLSLPLADKQSNWILATELTISMSTVPTPNSKNVLNSDVEVKGTLKFSGEMTFDGKVDGDINSEGALNLGDNAVIK